MQHLIEISSEQRERSRQFDLFIINLKRDREDCELLK